MSGRTNSSLVHRKSTCDATAVLLMDEPTSALDPIASAKIEELINELKTELTVIIVTHDMQVARVSDYTAFMYLGELVEYGANKADI